MRQSQTSPRAQALVHQLRSSIQEFRPSTSIEQAFYAQELDAVNNLQKDRDARILVLQQRLPPILWIALFGLAIIVVVFACLVGIEDTRLHMFGVATLAAGIALVFITIHVLERPFGTEFRVGPQPFELVVHEIEATGQQWRLACYD